MRARAGALVIAAGMGLSACAGTPSADTGVQPVFSFPVTSNHTPYSSCLSGLADVPGNNLPVFSVGEVADKTGQVNYDDNGHALTQGVSEMVISALWKTRKARLVERLDLRIPLAEMKLAEQAALAAAWANTSFRPATSSSSGR